MRPIWKGTIAFGLVAIPVKLYAATESKDINFRFIHKECKSPINYQKYCPVCAKKVDASELVKGYEYEAGHFVIIDEKEFEQLPLVNLKTIEIIDFVDLSEIDPIFFMKSYFLAPQEIAIKPYYLLLQAMQETGKIAVAKVIMRSKEQLACLRIYNNALLLETIFYPEEIRSTELISELNKKVSVNEKELNMAKELIKGLSTEFNPEKYTSSYREELLKIIEAKIQGEEVSVVQKPEAATITDLMDALKASLDRVEKDTKTKKKTAKRKKTTKEKVNIER